MKKKIFSRGLAYGVPGQLFIYTHTLFLVGVFKNQNQKGKVKKCQRKDVFIILPNALIIIKPGDPVKHKRIVSINFNVIIRQKIMQPLRTV